MPRFFRRVIRITAECSPNVRLALLQRLMGKTPTNEVVTPGVLTWAEYDKRRGITNPKSAWDPIRARIGLDAAFYEGKEVLLYPADWLDHANRLHDLLVSKGQVRKARAIGCDPGEGAAESAWAVVDEYGLIFLFALKTPDTTAVPRITVELMHRFNVSAENICLDRGGGGKQHADRLRQQGHKVRTVAFGESLTFDPKRSRRMFGEKVQNKEDRYTYINRRAQMYGELRLLLDPGRETLEGAGKGFAIPRTETELIRQLAPMPLLYDQEGRLKMLPKSKKTEDADDDRTLEALLGCSPDRADALVLGCYAMLHKGTKAHAGAV